MRTARSVAAIGDVLLRSTWPEHRKGGEMDIHEALYTPRMMRRCGRIRFH